MAGDGTDATRDLPETAAAPAEILPSSPSPLVLEPDGPDRRKPAMPS